METPEALKYTHHFNVYVCKAPVDQEADELFGPLVGRDATDCWNRTDIGLVRGYCTLSLYAWSFGGRVNIITGIINTFLEIIVLIIVKQLLTLPEDVGFPWGEDEVEYYYLETHVDNPQKLENITFETGVQFYDTDELRWVP